MRSRFRVVTEDTPASQSNTIALRLGDVIGPLTAAFNSNHAFLADFANDEIRLPADLVDVLTAFEQTQRAA